MIRWPRSVGTRTLLFGAHQVCIHPAALFVAWWRLYGFPADPRLWIAFLIHDWGYWGKPEMDGPEGELHVLWAAWVMRRLFGQRWGDLCLFHSRFWSKKLGQPYSQLCVADKLALAITPRWLYLPLVRATGEIGEYMHRADERRAAGEKTLHDRPMAGSTPEEWWARVTEHCRAWALEHADGRTDTWTPDMGQRVAVDESGVWR